MNIEHRKRILTALFLFLSAVALYWYVGHLAVQLLVAAIVFVSHWEFLHLLLDKKQDPKHLRLKTATSLIATVVILGIYAWKPVWSLLPIYFCFLTFLLTALVLGHFSRGENKDDELEGHLKDAIVQSFGIFYLPGFLSFVPAMHLLPQGPSLLLFLLLIIWGGDIGAYYGGRAWGKSPLSPSLSPKKTWEGTFSGIALCLLICLPVSWYFLPHIPLWGLALTAVISSLVAQSGDLLESLMKRVAKVKDSGTLFPGHGGVFDRFDSLILAAPMYYFLVTLFL